MMAATIGACALVAFAVTGAVLLMRSRYGVIVVQGSSMLPTYRGGELVLVRKGRRAIRLGDAVVFRTPGDVKGSGSPSWIIKRVVAVDGGQIAEGHRDRAGTCLVPPQCIWVVGDSLQASWDSRHFGPVQSESVLGVAVRKLG
jgi:signal peptidase I